MRQTMMRQRMAKKKRGRLAQRPKHRKMRQRKMKQRKMRQGQARKRMRCPKKRKFHATLDTSCMMIVKMRMRKVMQALQKKRSQQRAKDEPVKSLRLTMMAPGSMTSSSSWCRMTTLDRNRRSQCLTRSTSKKRQRLHHGTHHPRGGMMDIVLPMTVGMATVGREVAMVKAEVVAMATARVIAVVIARARAQARGKATEAMATAKARGTRAKDTTHLQDIARATAMEGGRGPPQAIREVIATTIGGMMAMAARTTVVAMVIMAMMTTAERVGQMAIKVGTTRAVGVPIGQQKAAQGKGSRGMKMALGTKASQEEGTPRWTSEACLECCHLPECVIILPEGKMEPSTS
mmetsp:Transcript_41353/g.74823  ORF Transcript_41353/g.74823 Transcript_41353/m.74823 type:complete len:347 (+) Transcript_41353:325-1365(+)